PMANNVGFALAAEALMGIEITPRCKVLRLIACEMSRIISHMVWLGTTSIDLGAFTPFLWAFQERERIYNLQEMWTGARLTTSVTRLGGMMADVPDGFVEGLRHFTRTFPRTLSEIDRVLTRNAVWVGRTQGVGALTAAEAINYSLSGPMLRASGVSYDVRKDKPYLDYETYEFDVVVGELGNYLVSDGTAKPVRWRIRPPSFINLSALPKMAEGHLLSDLIAINASVDIVMGEVDR